MILQLIMQLVINTLNFVFSWLPPVEKLPLGMDAVFVQASSYFHGAMLTLPYMQIVWTCFLYAVSFEILMIVLKFFLGHRAPGHPTN